MADTIKGKVQEAGHAVLDLCGDAADVAPDHRSRPERAVSYSRGCTGTIVPGVGFRRRAARRL